MATITVAAVQAAYVLMDRKATVAKVEELLADPAVRAADLVVFPEVLSQVRRSGLTVRRSGTVTSNASEADADGRRAHRVGNG